MRDPSDLLGIPFKHNGKLPEGLDCYGLVREVYNREGIILPTYDSPDGNDLIDILLTGEVYKYGHEIEKPEPLCMVRFMIVPPFITHVGVVLDDTRYFINIREKGNVLIERLDHRFWEPRIRGYFKWNSCSL